MLDSVLPTTPKLIGFDFDGVITLGIRPGMHDVIITGRSYQEAEDTYRLMNLMGIHCAVYFNPITVRNKSREAGGEWKSLMISKLGVGRFFEDDPIQFEIIRKNHPTLDLIKITHSADHLL